MKEIWKDIKGYEGKYQVSNLGRVKSLERFKKNHSKLKIVKEKILKEIYQNNGYITCNLYIDSKIKICSVHRLVAEAFIPNLENKREVNHIDGNKHNNYVSNLEWVSSSENQKHAYKLGLQKGSQKQKMAVSMTGKKQSKAVIQYDLQGNFIKEWESAQEIQRQLHIFQGNICKCCNGLRNKTGGYKWRYKEDT